MLKNRNVTLKDIAEDLGISINTVSRALRDCGDISSTLKDKVRETAISMGYVSTKYHLNSSNRYVVGMCFNSINDLYFSVVGEMIIKLFEAQNIDCLIFPLTSFQKVDREIMKKCISRNCDALVTFNEITNEASELAKLNRIPIVLVGRSSEDEYLDCIYTRDIDGGRMAASYLLEKGCKKICYIYEERSEASNRRETGMVKHFQKLGFTNYKLIGENELKHSLDLLIHGGYDGIFAYNDELIKNLYTFARMSQRNAIDYLDKTIKVGFDNTLALLGYNY